MNEFQTLEATKKVFALGCIKIAHIYAYGSYREVKQPDAKCLVTHFCPADSNKEHAKVTYRLMDVWVLPQERGE